MSDTKIVFTHDAQSPNRFLGLDSKERQRQIREKNKKLDEKQSHVKWQRDRIADFLAKIPGIEKDILETEKSIEMLTQEVKQLTIVSAEKSDTVDPVYIADRASNIEKILQSKCIQCKVLPTLKEIILLVDDSVELIEIPDFGIPIKAIKGFFA